MHDEFPCKLPPYTPIQDGQVVVLSVSDGCIVTAIGREVRIRPWENSNLQEWKVEAHEMRFGFRNLHSGMLLGVHFFGNVVAGEAQLNEWELFTLHPVEGGYKFTISNYWLFSTGPLVRPSLTDRLQYSSEQGYYSAIDIEIIEV
jgi:hypothetical protein